jgi:hypothetical protein
VAGGVHHRNWQVLWLPALLNSRGINIYSCPGVSFNIQSTLQMALLPRLAGTPVSEAPCPHLVSHILQESWKRSCDPCPLSLLTAVGRGWNYFPLSLLL